MGLRAEQVLPQGVQQGLHPGSIKVITDAATVAGAGEGVGDDDAGGLELHQPATHRVRVSVQVLGNLTGRRGSTLSEDANHGAREHSAEALKSCCHLTSDGLGVSEVARHPDMGPDRDPPQTTATRTTFIVVLGCWC